MSTKVKTVLVLGAIAMFTVAATAGWGMNPDGVSALLF